MGRAPCCSKVGLNKGAWTPQEDFRLITYIQKYGHSNWRALPKLAGLKRCGKSCRLRWINYLRPDIKRGNFTEEEEETIIKLHNKLGNKWSKIASCLPGRTDNEIKNVWNTHLKKRLEQKPRDNETTTTTTTTTTTEDNSPSILHETIEIPCETDMDISSFLINDDQQQFKSGLSVCSDSDSISTFNFSDAINSFEDAEKVDAFIDIANLAIEPEVWSDVEPKGSKELMSSGSSCHEVADWLKQLEGELMKDANYDHIMDPFLIRDFNFDDFKINCFLDNDV